MTLISILSYAFTLWFGAYLIRRNPGKPAMVYGGLGLLSYAAALPLVAFLSANGDMAKSPGKLAALLPALFWCAAALHLVSEDVRARLRSDWLTLLAISATAFVFTLLLADGPLVIDIAAWAAVTASTFGVITIARNIQQALPNDRMRFLFTAGIFFLLSIGILIIPIRWLSEDLALSAVGLDLLLLGFGIVWFDAFDEGERLLLDVLQSFSVAAILALIFGGQIALIMVIEDSFTPTWQLLLTAILTSAILLPIFYNDLQLLVDTIAFRRMPGLRAERARFRAISTALPRQSDPEQLTQLSDEEFIRLTRRALSAMGNLNRLASSPLIHLLGIEEDNTLERTNTLKRALTEGIKRLKPEDKGEFGTSDEWRHYNALYFPYVAGLKPYSRRQHTDHLDQHEYDALEWFRTYVPQRTLHNWQNEGAALVAQYLRENWQ